jgi:hypothetical protein
MKKTLGYGYKLSDESLVSALQWYGTPETLEYLLRTKKEVKKQVKFDRNRGLFHKNAKPRIFKVVIEVSED